MNKILQQQYFIKSQLLDINSILAKIANNQLACGSSSNIPNGKSDILKQFSFPLGTEEELNSFELFLQEDENFHKSVSFLLVMVDRIFIGFIVIYLF